MSRSDPPQVPELARSFAAAIARWLGRGAPRVEPDVLSARLAACRTCPDLELRAGARCRVCGCVVAVKARLPTEGCPRGRW